MASAWMGQGDPSGGIDTDYLERVADDIHLILGADIEIDAVEIVDVEPDPRVAEPAAASAGVAIRARYHLGERTFETTGPGLSLIDAHQQLRARLVVDRLRLTFSETVEPERKR